MKNNAVSDVLLRFLNITNIRMSQIYIEMW